MNKRTCTAAASLAAALLFPVAGALAVDVQTTPPTLEGRYIQGAEPERTVITITPLARGVYGLLADQWEGVGLFDGKNYWGVFRYGPKASPPELAGASGTHQAILRPDGSLAVHGEYAGGYSEAFDLTWTREPEANPRGRAGRPVPRSERPVWPREAPPAPPSGYPQLGDYVYVEELPEAITRVPPSYPEEARIAKIDGLVVVQALVGEDGLVKATHVEKSIPGLDEAAVACIQRWVYKPARAKGKPVAVWVAVPVRFTLH